MPRQRVDVRMQHLSKRRCKRYLGALLYKCLEIYFNDMYVHATTFALFLVALRAVFVTARRCIFLPLNKIV
jgi:hypothetical protein